MAEPSRPIRLLDRVRERLRIKHYSLRTEEAYLYWIRRYICFFGGKRHPETMGDAELTEFLTHLALDAQVAASTQNQALSALLFLYLWIARGLASSSCERRAFEPCSESGSACVLLCERHDA